MNPSTKILISILLTILLVQCTSNQQKQINHDFEIKVVETGKVRNDTIGWPKGLYYSIDVSLINNTDSTIHFWMNTCGWSENFIANFNKITILGPVKCMRNYPKVWKLNKNQKLDFKGLIVIPDSFYLKLDKRVGFIYIKENETSRLNEIILPPPGGSIQLRKHNTHDKIIWSKYFDVK